MSVLRAPEEIAEWFSDGSNCSGGRPASTNKFCRSCDQAAGSDPSLRHGQIRHYRVHFTLGD